MKTKNDKQFAIGIFLAILFGVAEKVVPSYLDYPISEKVQLTCIILWAACLLLAGCAADNAVNKRKEDAK